MLTVERTLSTVDGRLGPLANSDLAPEFDSRSTTHRLSLGVSLSTGLHSYRESLRALLKIQHEALRFPLRRGG